MDSDNKQKLQEVQQWLSNEYAGIRTGQATPAILDSVKVESYGTKVPVQQVGSIGVEDARTLRISCWDASQVSVIESAIADANLGVSVSTDSSGLRVVFPELTAERREQLLKLAKQKLEEARVRIKHVRDDVMKEIEKSQKDGDISEDEKFTQKEQVQKEIETANTALEGQFAQKESELKA